MSANLSRGPGNSAPMLRKLDPAHRRNVCSVQSSRASQWPPDKPSRLRTGKRAKADNEYALVTLAERGGSRAATYKTSLSETDPAKKDESGSELIRAIFGRDGVAEHPLL
jgi:hypothetical protein